MLDFIDNSLFPGIILDEGNPVKQMANGNMPVYGVFAKEPIPKGTVVGEYTGEVKTLAQFDEGINLDNESIKVYSFDLHSTYECPTVYPYLMTFAERNGVEVSRICWSWMAAKSVMNAYS